jgi:hypothetical protein
MAAEPLNEDVVVAVRAENLGRSYAAGTTFDRRCFECAARVGLAPSSRALLAQRPTVPVLCEVCALRHLDEVVAVEWIGKSDDR